MSKTKKEIPVKISGKQYTETSSYKDYFAGEIQVDGEIIAISSTSNATAVTSDFDTTNYYLALNPPQSKKAYRILIKGVIIEDETFENVDDREKVIKIMTALKKSINSNIDSITCL